LPISAQVVEARASRSTHPKTLKLMSELFSVIYGNNFEVINPFFYKTKSDVLKLLENYNGQTLIPMSRSCTRTMGSTRLHTHCGTCSQCIERRLAIQYNELEEHDPEEMYQTRLFLDKLDSGDDMAMVESYISHARLLEELDIDRFYERFPDGFNLARHLKPPIETAGQRLFDLHHSHGKQVAAVIKRQIELHSEEIRKGEIHPKSLLGIIIGKSSPKRRDKIPSKFFPTPDGTKWEDVTIELVSNDSIRIKVGGFVRRYSGFEIGFKDERKGDMLDTQWELLKLFAKNDGEISQRTVGFKNKSQKPVQALNKRLRVFFDMNSNPINRYSKESGWTTKFIISDKSFGKS